MHRTYNTCSLSLCIIIFIMFYYSTFIFNKLKMVCALNILFQNLLVNVVSLFEIIEVDIRHVMNFG
jgi:hypothetical protein